MSATIPTARSTSAPVRGARVGDGAELRTPAAVPESDSTPVLVSGDRVGDGAERHGSEPGPERDLHRERLARELERDAARKIRQARYRLPEPSPSGTEWDRLGWRERVLNAHRDRVDAALAERRERERTPPLVLRPNASGAASSRGTGWMAGASSESDSVERRNRDHWRDLARRILDRCPPDDGAFDWWGVEPEPEAPPKPDSGPEVAPSSAFPFTYRRPEAVRAVGRASVHFSSVVGSRTRVGTAGRTDTRSNGATGARTEPLVDPPGVPRVEPGTVGRAGSRRQDRSEVGAESQSGSEFEVDVAGSPLPSAPVPVPFHYSTVHVPRWSVLRRVLLWLFGPRLSVRPLWWAKTCRECRTEWPCRPLVRDLHDQYPTLDLFDTSRRDAELERLSHERHRPDVSSSGRRGRRGRRPIRRLASAHTL
ncbi:hypothetical protein STSO111631_15730 [Stackebrandtia soli]